jgi:phosphomethylpyrimidine synthase
VISLGDALRPGATADAHDELQIGELLVNSKLAREAVERGVQVMIEGPGHTTFDEVQPWSSHKPYHVWGLLWSSRCLRL